MKKKLVFVIPALLLIGFLAIKPPAVGSENKEQVIVTPTSTTTSTPLPKPQLRDFDDDGNGPEHFPHNDGDEGFGGRHDHHHGDDFLPHSDDLDEDGDDYED